MLHCEAMSLNSTVENSPGRISYEINVLLTVVKLHKQRSHRRQRSLMMRAQPVEVNVGGFTASGCFGGEIGHTTWFELSNLLKVNGWRPKIILVTTD